MFKKITILWIIILPGFCYSQIGDQIIKQVEKAHKVNSGVLNTNEPCALCGASVSGEELLKGCVKKTCADNGLPTMYEVPKITPEKWSQPADDEKTIEELFDKMASVKSPRDNDEENLRYITILTSGKLPFNKENLDLTFQLIIGSVFSQSMKFNPETSKAEFDESKFNNLKLELSEKNKLALKEGVKTLGGWL